MPQHEYKNSTCIHCGLRIGFITIKGLHTCKTHAGTPSIHEGADAGGYDDRTEIREVNMMHITIPASGNNSHAEAQSNINNPPQNQNTQGIPIGIDFGTSKTLLTWINPESGQPTAIRLGRGRDEIPTTVYLCEDGTLLFGDDADDNAQLDYSSYVRGFKLSLGSAIPLLVGSNKAYNSRQLTTEFLKHIKERCEKEAVMGAITAAVITVPAIFSPAQKEDLLEAAKNAGFTHVELLAEPVSAGMAFCNLSPKDTFEGSIVVVDWGAARWTSPSFHATQTGSLR